MFEDFLLAQTFPQLLDVSKMTRREKQAMVTLSGAVFRLQLQGAFGAATLAEM